METNTKYKNIIFDLGGVLVNWNPKKLAQDILSDKNISKYKISSQNLVEMFGSKIWNKLDCGTISKEEAIQSFMTIYKVDFDFFPFLYKKVQDHLYPLKNGLEIFDQIKVKGYKTYILSNFSKDLFENVSPNYKFLDSVDGAIISYRVKAIKPYPEIYKIFLDTFELKAEECLFIDDKEENIEGAKNAGIDGIVCNDHDVVVEEMVRRSVL